MSSGGRASIPLAWSGALAALAFVLAFGCSREAAKYPEVRARDAVVLVELAGIDAESGRFLTYRASAGRRVDFFVYRDSAGAPHAVLDACRTCYRWKKGYLLDGREVVCVKCDMRFKLDGLAQGPVQTPIQKSARRGLVIFVFELEAGAKYFSRGLPGDEVPIDGSLFAPALPAPRPFGAASRGDRQTPFGPRARRLLNLTERAVHAPGGPVLMIDARHDDGREGSGPGVLPHSPECASACEQSPMAPASPRLHRMPSILSARRGIGLRFPLSERTSKD
jgi:hypothetical protein